MAFRWSCLVHGLLLLVLSGSLTYRPAARPAAPDPEIAAARQFAEAVADKMPLWDADAISRYEGVEIATVKADIAMAQQEEVYGTGAAHTAVTAMQGTYGWQLAAGLPGTWQGCRSVGWWLDKHTVCTSVSVRHATAVVTLNVANDW